MKLGSPEYLEAMKEATNADAEYRRLAKDESESYLLVLEAEPARGVPETIVCGYQLRNGEIVEVWRGERKTDFVLSGPYGVWVDILCGKLGPTKALTMRRLKVRGNFLRLLATGDSTIRWVQVLRTIPTEFEGDYAGRRMSG